MTLRTFSYGGGVQSTTALVLAVQGQINFKLFLFANVGADPYPAPLPGCRPYRHPEVPATGAGGVGDDRIQSAMGEGAMTHPTTAPAALVRHARLVADLGQRRQFHQDRADELEQELIAREAERAGLVAAAWAACTTDAERQRLWDTLAGIDPEFWVD